MKAYKIDNHLICLDRVLHIEYQASPTNSKTYDLFVHYDTGMSVNIMSFQSLEIIDRYLELIQNKINEGEK